MTAVYLILDLFLYAAMGLIGFGVSLVFALAFGSVVIAAGTEAESENEINGGPQSSPLLKERSLPDPSGNGARATAQSAGALSSRQA